MIYQVHWVLGIQVGEDVFVCDIFSLSADAWGYRLERKDVLCVTFSLFLQSRHLTRWDEWTR